MKKETLRLRRLNFGEPDEFEVHTLEYRRVTKFFSRELNSHEKYYEVFVDGSQEPAGVVHQVSVSTSRSPRTSRVRYGLGSHLEWGWSRYPHKGEKQYTYNYPGLYGQTRRLAASDMLGFSSSTVEVVTEVAA